MDSPSNSHAESLRRDIITTFWRIVGPSHHPLACALYRTSAGLELRAGYEQGDLVRSTHIESEVAAAGVATNWKAATLAVGSFVDLAPEA